jgi:hypothetical protein
MREGRLALAQTVASSAPGAVRPTGTYSVEGGQVRVRLVLTRGGQKIGEAQVTGPEQDPGALVERILAAILQGAR